MAEIVRGFNEKLLHRLRESSPLIQVVLGPRQVGKTTGIKQVIEELELPSHYVSADKTIATSQTWLLDHWNSAKRLGDAAVFVVDEVQKIPNWSEVVKSLWDSEDKRSRLKVVLLGSSSLDLQSGLTESLTGRFELLPVYHWSYQETRQAFGWSFEQFLAFGGYPGSAPFVEDYDRWYAYLKNSIIDTVIGKDILEQKSVQKPALFRQAFEILSSYPAQEVSYTKLLGQLQDKGNTDLVKRYLELYEGAFLFRSLSKYAGKVIKTKSSSPKILPLCPALSSIHFGQRALEDPKVRGRLFELAVGGELCRLPGNLYYWRKGNDEVDFILESKGSLYAIEVKSGRVRKQSGLSAFCSEFPKSEPRIVSMSSAEEFFSAPENYLLGS